MTPLTYPRLRAIVDRIKADPSCWDQSDWHCGTAHCIAGHAQLDALSADRREEFLRRYHRTNLAQLSSWLGDTFGCVSARPFKAGKDWLGLTFAEANHLFRPKTTLEEIEALLEKARLFAASSESAGRWGEVSYQFRISPGDRVTLELDAGESVTFVAMADGALVEMTDDRPTEPCPPPPDKE